MGLLQRHPSKEEKEWFHQLYSIQVLFKKRDHLFPENTLQFKQASPDNQASAAELLNSRAALEALNKMKKRGLPLIDRIDPGDLRLNREWFGEYFWNLSSLHTAL